MVAPTPPSDSGGHSAHVKLELRIGSACYPLAQFGGDRLIFDEAVVLPGTTGEVLAMIDGHPRRWIATWAAYDSAREVVEAALRDPA